MTCEEFAVNFNLLLDGVLPDAEKENVLKHRQSCSGCQEYASGIEMVNEAVRARPLLDVPEDLVQKLIAIEEAETLPHVSWRPYVLRWIAICAAALVTYLLPFLLPELKAMLPNTLILTFGVVVASIRRLIPGIIAAGFQLQNAIRYRKEVFAE